MISRHTRPLKACHCCGLVHQLPTHRPGDRLRCIRCGSTIQSPAASRAISRCLALSVAALLLFPLAMSLPVMRLEQLGHSHTASIWGGTLDLLAAGEWFVGLVVLICSVIIPLLKLSGLVMLCLGDRLISESNRAVMYRLIEWTGRWGMIDVLLVAILVAAVKLGDLARITPGPGVIAFTAVVVLSLFASATFNPHAIWEAPNEHA